MLDIYGGWVLQWLMNPGASLWWACLMPRVCVARSVYCVGGVVFVLYGGGAVFHDVEFLCAEWWLAYLWSRSLEYAFVWLRLLVGFGWWCTVSYLDGISVCAQFAV